MSYLVKNIEKCISNDILDIREVKNALIFGSNAFEVTLEIIKILQNEKANIYLVLQTQMYEKIEDLLDDNINIIMWNGSYDLKIVEYIQKTLNCQFDAVLFYVQQANDLGNMNLFKIARALNENIKVFGMDKSLEVVQYNNFSYYCDALVLYESINKFVGLTEEMAEK